MFLWLLLILGLLGLCVAAVTGERLAVDVLLVVVLSFLQERWKKVGF